MSDQIQRIHVHHPGLLKITRITPQREEMIMDALSSLEEGRLEPDVIFPLLCPATITITTLTGKAYTFTIPVAGVGPPTMVEHLNDIGDVNVPEPTDGYVLYWDQQAGLWQAKALFPPPSRVKAFLSSAPQSIPPTTWTLVELDGEDYDNLDEFDHEATYTFTPKNPGAYLISGTVRYGDTPYPKLYFAGIFKNGTEIASAGSQTSLSGFLSAVVTDIALLAADDYIELKTWHNAPDNVSINKEHQTILVIHKLS